MMKFIEILICKRFSASIDVITSDGRILCATPDYRMTSLQALPVSLPDSNCNININLI